MLPSRFLLLPCVSAVPLCLLLWPYAVVGVAEYGMLVYSPAVIGLCAFILAVRVCRLDTDLDEFLTALQRVLPALCAPPLAALEQLLELYTARFAAPVRAETPMSVTSCGLGAPAI